MLRSYGDSERAQPSPLHAPNSATASIGVLEFNDHAERDDESTSARNQQPPPDGGYGWVCVGTCFTVNCFTWGVVAVGLSC
jgi:hypothetical protein